MKPAFEDHNVDASLGKIADVLQQPSGGYGAPSWAVANAKDVVEALEQLRDRMRASDMSLQHGAFPLAIYAARELRKYVAGAECDIRNRDAAQIFHRCLTGLVDELRALDQELAKKEAA
jgi:hypothetical protein